MIFDGQPLADLDISQIENWIKDKRRESIRLDYKRLLPGKTKEAKKEFVKDVTALANSVGGIIVYGVEEDPADPGVPRGIRDLDDVSRDEDERRLNATLRSHTYPVCKSPEFVWLPKENPKVLIVGVSRSTSGPHMAGVDEDRFWLRTMSGNNKMDVTEIRRAFLQAEDWGRRVERFRNERITDIWYNGVIPGLIRNHGLFFHCLPVGDRELLRDLRGANKSLAVIADLLNVSPRATYHIDGVRRWTGGDECTNYLQLFRTSGLEFFSQFTFVRVATGRQDDLALEGADIWYKFALFLRGIQVFTEIHPLDGPVQIMISVLGCSGLRVHVQGVYPSERYAFDRDEIAISPILVDVLPLDLLQTHRDAMTLFWQASGWPDQPFSEDRTKEMISALPSPEDILKRIT